MPLAAPALSTLMQANIAAKPSISATDATATKDLCDAIAAAVVTHITTAAVVVPTAMLAPPGTAGGPVTGVGNVT